MTTAARREPLTELDALTDQFGPLLDRMATTWRAVELDLTGRRKQVATCPTCHAPVRGLLADCANDNCRSAGIADAVALDMRCEV